MIAKIRFKGFSWEHNPKTLKVSLSDNLSEQKLSSSRNLVKHTSAGARKVSGEGQLCGDNCLYDFSRLLRLQSDSRSGILSIPDMKPFYAFFSGIKLLCEPSPKVITYAFEFVEDTSRKINREKRYHTVREDESLWDISYAYDVPIDELVRLNPDVRRLDEFLTGSAVRLC